MKSHSLKSKTCYLSLVTCLLFIIADIALASTLYFLPQGQTVYENDSFILELMLDTENEEINTVGIDLNYPDELLEFIEFNKGGSFLTLWAKEPSISKNQISFIAGVPNGFNGQGLVGRIVFKSKQVSQTKIDFEDSSQVLLNDGKGTVSSLHFLESDYEIIEKPEDLVEIYSNTHPSQYEWSKFNVLRLHWDLNEEAEYSYLLSRDPLAQPDEIPDKPEGDESFWVGDMKYADLEDGIYYFTLKQKFSDKDWSEAVSHRAMIDNTLPQEFNLEIGQEPAIFEGKYFLSFSTTDKTSGIDYYEIKEGNKDFKKITSPYLLEDQDLKTKIVVKAVDQAGNERIAEYIPEKKTEVIYLFILIIIILLVVFWIFKKFLISKNE